MSPSDRDFLITIHISLYRVNMCTSDRLFGIIWESYIMYLHQMFHEGETNIATKLMLKEPASTLTHKH